MTKNQWAHESKLLRELANDPETRWKIRGHAQDEMDNDNILLPDVVNVLCRGFIADAELVGGMWRYQVDGRNADGEPITIVAEPDSEDGRIRIITAWKPRRRRV